MSVKYVLPFLLTLCCCLGIPTGEITEYPTWRHGSEYPKVLSDPLGLDHLIVQWNAEGKIFMLNHNSTSSWFKAVRICEKYNMQLVTIENEEKSDMIRNLLEKYPSRADMFWMAGSRLQDGESWRWPNQEPIAYTNWCPGEPNNAKGDEMCIQVYPDNAWWNDEQCTIPNSFICENIAKEDKFQDIANANDILYEEENDSNSNSNKYYHLEPKYSSQELLDYLDYSDSSEDDSEKVEFDNNDRESLDSDPEVESDWSSVNTDMSDTMNNPSTTPVAADEIGVILGESEAIVTESGSITESNGWEDKNSDIDYGNWGLSKTTQDDISAGEDQISKESWSDKDNYNSNYRSEKRPEDVYQRYRDYVPKEYW
ncbi:hypothetical protein NQ318_015704 [Aromia moschata]|uniref:C-type lectin domain-containing protein n=1 Tax=Aromia moschata TaxID=1265417 RepID=A0AAV8YGJ9_9CUCU|nr:hypothetical protein NQ318_015704 [Aromia moschata]